MRRSIHIAVSLFGVILLLKPFDYFGSAEVRPKTAECCKQGKCMPSSNSDECCKGTIPGGRQFFDKAQESVFPPVVFVLVGLPVCDVPEFRGRLSSETFLPTTSPPISRLNRVLVRAEIMGEGHQLKLPGTDEIITLQEDSKLVGEMKKLAGKTVTLEGTLTPDKDLKRPAPLRVEAIK